MMDYSNYAGHQSQPYSLYGLPTPDQQPQSQSDDTLRDPFTLDAYNNQYFPGFDPSFRLDPSSSLVPPPHSPPDSFTKHSVSSNDVNHTKTDRTSIDGDERHYTDPAGHSSSEEKDNMTPVQSKRKAQNRAAQRAFRERKERHVRDLEDKVNGLVEASNTLQADNERLKRELARYTTENEILRATSQSNSTPQEQPEPTVTGPMKYSPTDFYASLMTEGTVSSGSGVTVPGPSSPHRVTVCQITGEKLLDAGGTWDLIQSHELFKRGQVDIGDVSERLKGLAQCNGQGPAFKESEIRRAIEESVADRDELI
ncbi:hypothetical protein N7448_006477 [Penicillium atrosanguineum]|uniref:Uncharacterized protein n=1 Tax=Penicillium atrosanguineum TaxID=1132637 RepID=A0A9W9L2K6_9EURO|nr:Protein yippee-like [Penicillium atrosanguineum]KAJ5132319.1 hypothetical protein N7448_006477 [Penicillium atrosanguineum]KAJ5137469.1 hypothetical protein N7526_003702 [Penicillium atrosanguineum]KAJ5289986.1 Protein yippee-like [Penicillium atrosanguineum]KAJ5307808.1 hypothetical protein N7476_008464 [Penicillium atrosanguineum]